MSKARHFSIFCYRFSQRSSFFCSAAKVGERRKGSALNWRFVSAMKPLNISSGNHPISLFFPAKLKKTPPLLHVALRSVPVFPSPRRATRIIRVQASSSEESHLKSQWLDSLSTPFLQTGDPHVGEGYPVPATSSSDWVIGIDPDTSGALALLGGGGENSSPSEQVFDNPNVKLLVGKKIRKRLDARSIVQLLSSFNMPLGTTAYIEQSIPFPRDGKQGWWSGGYNYGLWIGILVASGFSVVPVSARLWKDHFELSGSSSTKGDSRELASVLFPSLASSLKRKKDHGRAEALLIAAYGKVVKRSQESSWQNLTTSTTTTVSGRVFHLESIEA